MSGRAPPHHPERISWYTAGDGLNLDGIDFPTPVSQISRIEGQNNLAINVFGWDGDVIIHRLSKQPGDMPRINLLLIGKAGEIHYT